VYIYLQSSKTTIPCYLGYHSFILISLYPRLLLHQVCLIIKYPILLLTYLPHLPSTLLFIFSTCKSSAEVVTIEPSTIPVDGSNSTLVRVGPVEESPNLAIDLATDATVEESLIIETTALIPPTNVFNSTEGVVEQGEHKLGWGALVSFGVDSLLLSASPLLFPKMF
jgi:hypothetical protein